MGQTLGGSQITALLETVPGIASVLRSPVADALVNTIRAGAGIAELRIEDVQELLQYATRRGLVGADEGDRLINEVQNALANRRPKAAAPKPARTKPAASARKPARKAPKPAKPKGKKRR
jgi:hypothetical protein